MQVVFLLKSFLFEFIKKINKNKQTNKNKTLDRTTLNMHKTDKKNISRNVVSLMTVACIEMVEFSI